MGRAGRIGGQKARSERLLQSRSGGVLARKNGAGSIWPADSDIRIQRVNTVGGKAPTAPGDYVGELVRVPYTAEYFFYRADP